MGPSSRMTPTGLHETGGSIANDVYSNSIYAFSIKIPPGWVVLPSREPKVATQDAALLKAAQLSHPLLVITENAPLKKSYQRKNIQIIATPLRGPSTPNAEPSHAPRRAALTCLLPIPGKELRQPCRSLGTSYARGRSEATIPPVGA